MPAWHKLCKKKKIRGNNSIQSQWQPVVFYIGSMKSDVQTVDGQKIATVPKRCEPFQIACPSSLADHADCICISWGPCHEHSMLRCFNPGVSARAHEQSKLSPLVPGDRVQLPFNVEWLRRPALGLNDQH
eukprot:gnl/MRDRNA2_/MRDRNA2_84869_c0_seq1.p1 gnl/MRDRNA2_/MRDRNA2_84869_c0~~gnl/MRDRNA2_/MRDRNA2_84869_c0_seq1.p1  ORF type:complete len:130 (+),score=3.41 gnl/MRDRNA2_/MRDRNA2_84869_c0_seq1:53-442(+)